MMTDDQARDFIIKNTDKNVFTVAGAGSGKTTILVNRMVAMIENGIDISKIVAITFTKNAAQEFLARFQEQLKERSVAPDICPDTRAGSLGDSCPGKRKRCKDALSKIYLCFAGTIDAYCNLILSEMPLSAGIPSSARVIEDDEATLLYKSEYEKVAGDVTCPEHGAFKNFHTVHRNAGDVFAGSIGDVMDASVLDLCYPTCSGDCQSLFDRFRDKYESDYRSDIKTLLGMRDSVLTVDGRGTPTRQYSEEFDTFEGGSNRLLREWKPEECPVIPSLKIRFSEDPQTKLFKFNRKEYKKGQIVSYEFEKSSLDCVINDYRDYVYQCSMAFLSQMVDRIKTRMRREGKMTFTECLLAFRDMLAADTDGHVREHIRERHEYYLLDESQDTSPIQNDLFLKLTEDIGKGRLLPGRLFIVGDPKQSIYRFRGADVGSYNRMKEHFSEDTNDSDVIVRLKKNFRSKSPLCTYFDSRFGDMDDYEPIETVRGVSAGETSGVYRYECSCTDLIQTIVNNPDWQIDTGGGPRLIDYGDVMIVTGTTTPHAKLMEAMEAGRIPFYVNGKYTIGGNPLLSTAISVYAYLISDDYDAKKSGCLADMLAGSLFGLTDKQVIEAQNGNFDPANDPATRDAWKDVNDLRERAKALGPVALFEAVLTELRLFDYVPLVKPDYAYHALEQMKAADANGEIGNYRDAYARLLDISTKVTERSLTLEDTPSAVFLANLHKVKGLERPIVILEPSGDSDVSAQKRLDYTDNKSYVFCTSRYTNNYTHQTGYRIQTSQYADKYESEVGELEKERQRLLYVAATRAKNILFIGTRKRATIWDSLIPAHAAEFNAAPKAVFPETVQLSELCLTGNKTADFSVKPVYVNKTPSKLRLIHTSEPASEPEEKDYNSRLKGTVIHQLLEKIVASENSLPKDSLIKSILDENTLTDSGIEKTYSGLLNDVYDAFLNGGYPQDPGKAEDLWAEIKNAEEVYTEIPFSYRVDGPDGTETEIWEGTIDLLYRSDKGDWYIVDYKTNYDGTDLDTVYRNQLEAYKKALESQGIAAKYYIWHIKAGNPA